MSHTIDKAGERFEQELVRRFHCGGRYATASAVNQQFDESPFDAAGEAFVGEVLRRFSNDGSYREDGEAS